MQSTFERYEKKYLITREQYAALQPIFSRYMELDRYGEYLVQNLYYDTDKWDVIRTSMEGPFYKEKMRLRCYGAMNADSDLFLELKKKCAGIVHKRRITIPAQTLAGSSVQRVLSADSSQIARELDFYMKANAVTERIYISYRRTAIAGVANEGLRITFDSDLRFRLDCLYFARPGQGISILPQDTMLMEVKTLGAMPLWLAHALCENKVHPTSFSKYGVCYSEHIYGNIKVKGRVPISA